MKRCTICSEEKAEKEFGPSKSSRDGLRSSCKPCESERTSKIRQKLNANASERIRNDGDKMCSECGETKSLSEFVVSILCSDGRAGYCSACDRKKRRERRSDPSRNKMQLETERRYRAERPEFCLWLSARRRAKKRGIEFSISTSDITIPDVCPILGIPLGKSGKRGPSSGSPTLDRLDNERGYVPGNVAVISHRANTLKSNISLDEIRRLLNFLERHLA